ncbi:MAG: hypothetical protein LKF01_00355 [Lactobacillus sp.]|nr:hypothetical protein [Lactobacillus sp.]MCH4067995.1 hypothetical protein [Lactobacillus sp.]MCI1304049.1 hypothetical protein [Lactobacillus sp.]MCI1329925.1 hypothetical protein [Lactobacillus sp.]MCI1399525.1 hypothetical protein [Lactobacillus sp.]
MFAEIQLIFRTAAESITRPYLKLAKSMIKPKNDFNRPATVGGFTNQDWENIGNDLRRSIIAYGKSRLS